MPFYAARGRVVILTLLLRLQAYLLAAGASLWPFAATPICNVLYH